MDAKTERRIREEIKKLSLFIKARTPMDDDDLLWRGATIRAVAERDFLRPLLPKRGKK